MAIKASNIKGALLEYIVRNLLRSCGFTNVKADNLFSFERGGLFFVNGKGAAHDADVIMNPPVQMPFTYPTQVIFECKAYGSGTSLPVVRNALGLRNDLNDFEIVTRETLLQRQNFRRAPYAIDSRKRFLYQVGVASVNDFSKPAIEFSTNNKIPLISLSWFLSPSIITDFNNITQPLVDGFNDKDIKNLYDYLKDRNGDFSSRNYSSAHHIIRGENIISRILESASDSLRRSYVGLLETGDLIFLFSQTTVPDFENHEFRGIPNLEAEIHWMSSTPNKWLLSIRPAHRWGDTEPTMEFEFFLPKRIFNHWKQYNLDKSRALDIKQEFFSKVFIFNKRERPEAPFFVVNINREWLEIARYNLRNRPYRD